MKATRCSFNPVQFGGVTMARRKKLISIRKPKLKITRKGVKVTKPSARIGGKAGVNLSSKGVSASLRTGKGHVNVNSKGKASGRVGGKAGVNFSEAGMKPTIRKKRKRWWQFWK
jgi:hypothetical protein